LRRKENERTLNQPVKRKLSSLMAAVVILTGAAFVCMPDGSVRWNDFETRFRASVNAAGFKVLAESSCSVDEVPLPRRIEWHPRHWSWDSGIHLATGFPNGAVHYELSVGGSSETLDCRVRYVDGRAVFVVIRAGAAQEPAARALRAVMEREFPWLSIEVTIHGA
jgi:hypothetical protein